MAKQFLYSSMGTSTSGFDEPVNYSSTSKARMTGVAYRNPIRAESMQFNPTRAALF
jgi:hypothetical protein